MTKLGKLMAAMIDGGTINRAEYPIGHIGRTRDLEKMSSGEALAVHGWRLAVHSLQFTVRGWRSGVGVRAIHQWDLCDL